MPTEYLHLPTAWRDRAWLAGLILAALWEWVRPSHKPWP